MSLCYILPVMRIAVQLWKPSESALHFFPSNAQAFIDVTTFSETFYSGSWIWLIQDRRATCNLRLLRPLSVWAILLLRCACTPPFVPSTTFYACCKRMALT